MTKKPSKGKSAPRAKGFWDRTEPDAKPEILSIRDAPSRLARCLNFLKRLTGRKPDGRAR